MVDDLIRLDEIQRLPDCFSTLRSDSSFYELQDAIRPEAVVIIAPIDSSYEIRRGIVVASPSELLNDGILPLSARE